MTMMYVYWYHLSSIVDAHLQMLLINLTGDLLNLIYKVRKC